MGLLAAEKIIVTGAARGIGLAIVEACLAQGASVAMLDIDEPALCVQRERLGCVGIAVDVSDEQALVAAIESAAERLGGLTGLVNNAGSGAVAPLHGYSPEHFDRLLKDNLYSVFYACRAVTAAMAESGGVIVNIASQTAERPTFGEAPYSAAKAGVVALTKSMAMEYGPQIRCNAISPGVIDTPMTAGILAPEMIAPMIAQTPAGRVGSASDVADVAVFLLSKMSSYISGQNLAVDGGLSLPQAGINDITRSITAMVAAAGQRETEHE